MKTMDRRVFIGSVAGAAIATAVPALAVVASELRHGPVDMKLVWLFGVTSFKTTLVAHPTKDILTFVVDDAGWDEVNLVMVRSEVAKIVNQRGEGCVVATRVTEDAPRKIDSLLVRLQVHRNTLRIMDPAEAARGQRPSVAMLRLEDIQVVLPKA